MGKRGRGTLTRCIIVRILAFQTAFICCYMYLLFVHGGVSFAETPQHPVHTSWLPQEAYRHVTFDVRLPLSCSIGFTPEELAALKLPPDLMKDLPPELQKECTIM